MAIKAVSTVEMVRKKFPQAIVETVEFRGEQTIVLKPEHLVAVCTYLHKNLKYTFLSTVTAVDWFERVPRYDVVYHLLSIRHQSELRLKVRVSERGVGADLSQPPSVPTVVGVWPSANWYEREVYDLFGITFAGHPDLRRTVIRSGVHNEVRFFGFVPIDVLRIFYDVANVFIFPSLYEGFGLPPLEAMAHGTPVVTSNTSSLPEVVGNAAVLVNPENVFEIMRATHRVLVDQALREKLRQRGYEQAKRFSWDSSARRILRIYKEVVSGKEGGDVPEAAEAERPRLRA